MTSNLLGYETKDELGVDPPRLESEILWPTHRVPQAPFPSLPPRAQRHQGPGLGSFLEPKAIYSFESHEILANSLDGAPPIPLSEDESDDGVRRFSPRIAPTIASLAMEICQACRAGHLAKRLCVGDPCEKCARRSIPCVRRAQLKRGPKARRPLDAHPEPCDAPPMTVRVRTMNEKLDEFRALLVDHHISLHGSSFEARFLHLAVAICAPPHEPREFVRAPGRRPGDDANVRGLHLEVESAVSDPPCIFFPEDSFLFIHWCGSSTSFVLETSASFSSICKWEARDIQTGLSLPLKLDGILPYGLDVLALISDADPCDLVALLRQIQARPPRIEMSEVYNLQLRIVTKRRVHVGRFFGFLTLRKTELLGEEYIHGAIEFQAVEAPGVVEQNATSMLRESHEVDVKHTTDWTLSKQQHNSDFSDFAVPELTRKNSFDEEIDAVFSELVNLGSHENLADVPYFPHSDGSL